MNCFKQLSFTILFLFFSCTLLVAQDAKQIVQNAVDHLRGNSAISEINFKVIRPAWNRSMDIKSWSKGDDYALILILSPAKDKGTAFLKRKKEIWNWLPSLERTIKLPPSMMSQSWMGTDFTNDDLVQESSIVDDYTHTILGNELVEGYDCYKIELVPNTDAAVVWGKIILWIEKNNFLQLRTEFYDEDNYLINTLQGSEVKVLDGRLLPTKMVMSPADKPGHLTVITYKTLKLNMKIEDNFFTLQNLKKVK